MSAKEEITTLWEWIESEQPSAEDIRARVAEITSTPPEFVRVDILNRVIEVGTAETVKAYYARLRAEIAAALEGYVHKVVPSEEMARKQIAELYGVPVSAVEVDLASGTAHVTLPTPCEKLAFEVVVR